MIISFVDFGRNGTALLPYSPQVHEDVIASVLRRWGFTEADLDKLQIVFEVRYIIRSCIQGPLADGYSFVIYLRELEFRDQAELNKTVAHELRHLYYMLKVRPGVNWVVRWEEHNCRRIEKQFEHTNFIQL